MRAANEAVLWIERGGVGGEPPHKVIAYLEGTSRSTTSKRRGERKAAGAATITDKTWFGRFFSVQPVDVRPMQTGAAAQGPARNLRARAGARSAHPADTVQKTQFAEPVPSPPPMVGPPSA